MNVFIKKLITTFIWLSLVYILISVVFYLFQDNFLFFPKKTPKSLQEISNGGTIEKIKIKNGSANYLYGWYCRKGIEGKQKTIIYFGGNRDEVSYLIPQSNEIFGWGILLINYPGYGNSDGNPNEKNFYTAAINIYDYISSRSDIDTNNIVIMGRSIGTGVATFLASQRKQKGVILISPFASITDVVKEKLGFFPIDLILKNKFDSKQYAMSIKSPLLCIYGTNDMVVPYKHSKALMKYWGGKVVPFEMKGFDHSNLLGSKKVWNIINGFLEELDQ